MAEKPKKMEKVTQEPKETDSEKIVKIAVIAFDAFITLFLVGSYFNIQFHDTGARVFTFICYAIIWAIAVGMANIVITIVIGALGIGATVKQSYDEHIEKKKAEDDFYALLIERGYTMCEEVPVITTENYKS